MITTIASALLCATVSARQAPDIPRDLGVCVEIATTAHAHGVSPRLAVAVGWTETRWKYGLVSAAGCHGPMQVKPYHCPGETLRGCPLVLTGVLVLRRYIAEEGSVKRGLCRYATGTGYAWCEYAGEVLDVVGGAA